MLQHGLLSFIPTENILSHSSKIGNNQFCLAFLNFPLCVKKISIDHPVTLVIVIIISLTEEKK